MMNKKIIQVSYLQIPNLLIKHMLDKFKFNEIIPFYNYKPNTSYSNPNFYPAFFNTTQSQF